ncbi:MAG: ParB/RepB/Spo0J family partition protein [Acidimicrobiales bacterium]|jgi:ParB/RepB/Spo0J family partition protein|nr:ParB/RepB/Spo0J family partition protein [Acidimicrobiales bacterium]
MLSLLPIDSVVPAEDNLRRRTGDVRDLAASIASVGIVEPLLVSPVEGDRYVIVAGHRRHAAAVKAGLGEVPCTIRLLTDAERVEIMLVENLQRCDLSPIEEASGYFRLVEHGLTQRELASRIGRSARHVAARLALLELPKTVQRELHAGTLTVADGQALLGLRDHPEVIDAIVGDEWERRDIERAVLRAQHRLDAADRTTTPDPDPDAKDGDTDRDADGDADRSTADDDPEAEAGGQPPGTETGERAAPPEGDRAGERQAVERAEFKARTAASRARIEFARSLLARRVPKGDIVALAAAQVVGDLSASHAKLTCRLLGIDPVEGTYGPDHRSAVEAYAAESPGNRDRALLAVAFAIGEDQARYGATTTVAARHVEFLTSYGLDTPTAAG